MARDTERVHPAARSASSSGARGAPGNRVRMKLSQNARSAARRARRPVRKARATRAELDDPPTSAEMSRKREWTGGRASSIAMRPGNRARCAP